ncbi:MAG: hypothetical protein WC740_20455 [Verrucomicrobiia bacterium]
MEPLFKASGSSKRDVRKKIVRMIAVAIVKATWWIKRQEKLEPDHAPSDARSRGGERLVQLFSDKRMFEEPREVFNHV